MKYRNSVRHEGGVYYLRNTVWTTEPERADLHETEEQAKSAARKAEKFMHPKIKRTYYTELIDV